ncbi:MAG: MBL fold metallo-hydrolase [Gammaproteobacteria bacterium]|nr:MBL fold metallo-hydrolase [Gammaproteobacteria bacterium]
MTSAKLTVLDVGHGNCALIHSDKNFIMIDAAVGSFVQDTVKNIGITKIDSVIISHADQDHIGGLSALLLDDSIHIETVYINGDAAKQTKTFTDLLIALDAARSQNRPTKVITSINKDTDDIVYEDFVLEVLSPCPIRCLRGIGQSDLKGKEIEANAMSVVVRLLHDGEKVALITGDMNDKSLQFLKDEGTCVEAKILVFPHHGGLPTEKDPHVFAAELNNLVRPELIIFSNSRQRHDNPRQEIIDGIIASDCSPSIACTQLSKGCHDDDNDLSNDHLIELYPSKGRSNNNSCAGTIDLILNGSDTDIHHPLEHHVNYINKFENRKCKRVI